MEAYVTHVAAAIAERQICNAVPLYRLGRQEFKRYGLAIARQNMANWMISWVRNTFLFCELSSPELYNYHVIERMRHRCL